MHNMHYLLPAGTDIMHQVPDVINSTARGLYELHMGWGLVPDLDQMTDYTVTVIRLLSHLDLCC
jgi:hypothetical protein